jgi:ABC-type multidrug transport system fused ATPase/permease subunit
MYFFLGKIINLMGEYTMLKFSGKDPDVDKKLKEVSYYSIGFFALAVACGIVKFCESFLWIRTCSYLSVKLRKDLFQNMMKYEVAFFDVTPIGGILTFLSEDSQQFQDVFGTVK